MLEDRKEKARGWFERLRDEITQSFETLEAELPASAPNGDQPAGTFERTPWPRTDHVTGLAGGGG
ncbi:MAG: coproporphyrinogen III oxidase, partial [Alphaproteobacteria bacterium]|nr:coproporphyrinogen III oxidase [Alphaproteobacteria bacterium]